MINISAKQKKRPAAVSLLAGACALLALTAMAQPVPASSPAPASASAMDLTQKPGDDFYAYTNGGWMAATAIPGDRSNWGAGGILVEDTNARIIKLIEAAAQAKDGSLPRKVSDFYTSFLDVASIEARGLAPLQPLLKKIAAIDTSEALAQALGSSMRADVDALNATEFYTPNLFGLWVVQGLHDPAHYTPYLLQGGLGMPDRAYYLTDSPKMAATRAAYLKHIVKVLTLAGVPDAQVRGERIFDLEHAIAQAHASREASADVNNAKSWSRADFARKAPGMPWQAFFKAAGLSAQKQFIVWQPGAVSGAAKLVASTPLAVWRDYLSYHVYNHYSDTLPQAFADERFAFYGTVLSGTPQQPNRSKRALAAVNEAMADAVGRMYVERYFPPEAKARAQAMVVNLVAAFSKRIERLDWMAPATKVQAQAKLKALYVGVGYPDSWQSFDSLQVKAGDALGNTVRAEQLKYQRTLAKLGQPVDKKEWCMPPQLVNAVNMPMQNALNFPAAILQAPFFDLKASDAANYGAIGSVIGHEITHSFDDQGAQFDATGRLRNWWSRADLKHFQAASKALATQYSAYKPFPDLALNGQQTLSENIADLGGLNAALDAYHVSLHGKPAPLVDGRSGDQQFFIAFAQSWRTKMREAALRRAVVTDGHAPAPYRTMTVRNLDAWYQAFDVQPGQALYLTPAQRVRIW
jgi:putative endopeptidase